MPLVLNTNNGLCTSYRLVNSNNSLSASYSDQLTFHSEGIYTMHLTFNLNHDSYNPGTADKSFIFSINSTNCSNNSIPMYMTENTLGFLAFNAQGPNDNVSQGYIHQGPIMSCFNIKNSNDGSLQSYPVCLSLTATLYIPSCSNISIGFTNLNSYPTMFGTSMSSPTFSIFNSFFTIQMIKSGKP